MKKYIQITVATLLTSATCFAGKLNIVTTTTDLASIAEVVAGDLAKVKSICTGNQDPHHLQARPKFVMMARNADLWIRTGLDLEIGWETPVIDGSRNRKIRLGNPGHLDASTRIYKLDIPAQALLTRAMGDVHPLGNPHYLTDPLNAKIVAEDIAKRLCQLDKKNAETYTANAKAFADKIDAKMIEWKAAMAPLSGANIVTYHRSWIYFCNQFNLNVAIELEPKPGIPPSPSHLIRVAQTVETQDVKLILQEPWYSKKAAQRIQDKTEVSIVMAPLFTKSDPAAQTYIELIELIVKRLTTSTK